MNKPLGSLDKKTVTRSILLKPCNHRNSSGWQNRLTWIGTSHILDTISNPICNRSIDFCVLIVSSLLLLVGRIPYVTKSVTRRIRMFGRNQTDHHRRHQPESNTSHTHVLTSQSTTQPPCSHHVARLAQQSDETINHHWGTLGFHLQFDSQSTKLHLPQHSSSQSFQLQTFALMHHRSKSANCVEWMVVGSKHCLSKASQQRKSKKQNVGTNAQFISFSKQSIQQIQMHTPSSLWANQPLTLVNCCDKKMLSELFCIFLWFAKSKIDFTMLLHCDFKQKHSMCSVCSEKWIIIQTKFIGATFWSERFENLLLFTKQWMAEKLTNVLCIQFLTHSWQWTWPIDKLCKSQICKSSWMELAACSEMANHFPCKMQKNLTDLNIGNVSQFSVCSPITWINVWQICAVVVCHFCAKVNKFCLLFWLCKAQATPWFNWKLCVFNQIAFSSRAMKFDSESLGNIRIFQNVCTQKNEIAWQQNSVPLQAELTNHKVCWASIWSCNKLCLLDCFASQMPPLDSCSFAQFVRETQILNILCGRFHDESSKQMKQHWFKHMFKICGKLFGSKCVLTIILRCRCALLRASSDCHGTRRFAQKWRFVTCEFRWVGFIGRAPEWTLACVRRGKLTTVDCSTGLHDILNAPTTPDDTTTAPSARRWSQGHHDRKDITTTKRREEVALPALH